jgi:hypothetical protein
VHRSAVAAYWKSFSNPRTWSQYLHMLPYMCSSGMFVNSGICYVCTHLLQPPNKLQLCPRSSSALVAMVLMLHKRKDLLRVVRANRPTAAACLAAVLPTVSSIRPCQHCYDSSRQQTGLCPVLQSEIGLPDDGSSGTATIIERHRWRR